LLVPKRLPPRYDLPKAAPEPLRLVQLFLNTKDHEHGREWLSTPAEARAWLAERGFRASVTESDVSRLHRVRSALHRFLLGELDDAARATLERETKRAPLRVTFDDAALAPLERGVDAFLGRLFAVVHDAVVDGSWPRLKGCRNCHWVFYDESKNRSATWCSMELCGNRLKTKRYRRRHASTAPTTAPNAT
jgi:predicted RNA-binding Zn ribbon-like protein